MGPASEEDNFLDTALELLSNAIDAEEKREYTEAHAKYMAALDYLMAAQQSETNEKSRAFLKTKADEYLNRAEAVRQRIDNADVLAADVSSPGNVQLVGGHPTAQSVILDEAFNCAKEAVNADASQDYAEAYQLYMKSMDYFMFAQRYELNDQSRSLIRLEVSEYLSRAETIKKHLESLRVSRIAKSVSLSKGPPRPPEVIFLHTAIEITQRAIRQDNENNHRSAFELYNSALDYFMLAQKYEKNEQSRMAIRESMEEYLTRAEALKKRI